MTPELLAWKNKKGNEWFATVYDTDKPHAYVVLDRQTGQFKPAATKDLHAFLRAIKYRQVKDDWKGDIVKHIDEVGLDIVIRRDIFTGEAVFPGETQEALTIERFLLGWFIKVLNWTDLSTPAAQEKLIAELALEQLPAMYAKIAARLDAAMKAPEHKPTEDTKVLSRVKALMYYTDDSNTVGETQQSEAQQLWKQAMDWIMNFRTRPRRRVKVYFREVDRYVEVEDNLSRMGDDPALTLRYVDPRGIPSSQGTKVTSVEAFTQALHALVDDSITPEEALNALLRVWGAVA